MYVVNDVETNGTSLVDNILSENLVKYLKEKAKLVCG